MPIAREALEALLTTVSVPTTALTERGEKDTEKFAVPRACSVSGKLSPSTATPAPEVFAAVIVTGAPPEFVSVTGWVLFAPIATAPKLRLAGLIVSVPG